MKKSALFILVFFIAFKISAQDKIYLKTRKIIECKITELGETEIKYKKPNYAENITFSIAVEKVSKVVLESGEVVKYGKSELYNPDNYIDDYPNAIKVNFLSPLTGALRFSYEHNIKPGMSLTGDFGIVGIGTDLGDENPLGATFGFGVKFIKGPDFNGKRQRFSHLLQGLYFSPNFVFSVFGRDQTVYTYAPSPAETKIRQNVTCGAVMLTGGQQWVFGNIFLVDFNVGIGYGFSSLSDNIATYGYGFSVAGSSFPIAFSSNLRIGFLFAGKKTKKLKE